MDTINYQQEENRLLNYAYSVNGDSSDYDIENACRIFENRLFKGNDTEQVRKLVNEKQFIGGNKDRLSMYKRMFSGDVTAWESEEQRQWNALQTPEEKLSFSKKIISEDEINYTRDYLGRERGAILQKHFPNGMETPEEGDRIQRVLGSEILIRTPENQKKFSERYANYKKEIDSIDENALKSKYQEDVFSKVEEILEQRNKALMLSYASRVLSPEALDVMQELSANDWQIPGHVSGIGKTIAETSFIANELVDYSGRSSDLAKRLLSLSDREKQFITAMAYNAKDYETSFWQHNFFGQLGKGFFDSTIGMVSGAMDWVHDSVVRMAIGGEAYQARQEHQALMNAIESPLYEQSTELAQVGNIVGSFVGFIGTELALKGLGSVAASTIGKGSALRAVNLGKAAKYASEAKLSNSFELARLAAEANAKTTAGQRILANYLSSKVPFTVFSLSAADDMMEQRAAQGGDVSSWESWLSAIACGVAYTGIEYMQAKQMFGTTKSATSLVGARKSAIRAEVEYRKALRKLGESAPQRGSAQYNMGLYDYMYRRTLSKVWNAMNGVTKTGLVSLEELHEEMLQDAIQAGYVEAGIEDGDVAQAMAKAYIQTGKDLWFPMAGAMFMGGIFRKGLRTMAQKSPQFAELSKGLVQTPYTIEELYQAETALRAMVQQARSGEVPQAEMERYTSAIERVLPAYVRARNTGLRGEALAQVISDEMSRIGLFQGSESLDPQQRKQQEAILKAMGENLNAIWNELEHDTGLFGSETLNKLKEISKYRELSEYDIVKYVAKRFPDFFEYIEDKDGTKSIKIKVQGNEEIIPITEGDVAVELDDVIVDDAHPRLRSAAKQIVSALNKLGYNITPEMWLDTTGKSWKGLTDPTGNKIGQSFNSIQDFWSTVLQIAHDNGISPNANIQKVQADDGNIVGRKIVLDNKKPSYEKGAVLHEIFHAVEDMLSTALSAEEFQAFRSAGGLNDEQRADLAWQDLIKLVPRSSGFAKNRYTGLLNGSWLGVLADNLASFAERMGVLKYDEQYQLRVLSDEELANVNATNYVNNILQAAYTGNIDALKKALQSVVGWDNRFNELNALVQDYINNSTDENAQKLEAVARENPYLLMETPTDTEYQLALDELASIANTKEARALIRKKLIMAGNHYSIDALLKLLDELDPAKNKLAARETCVLRYLTTHPEQLVPYRKQRLEAIENYIAERGATEGARKAAQDRLLEKAQQELVMSEIAVKYADPIRIANNKILYRGMLDLTESATEDKAFSLRSEQLMNMPHVQNLYQAWHTDDGTPKAGYMRAPNGEKTNLSELQWLMVRTTPFKNWFGDWENDPKNSSKVIDENGEPLVVYHGTDVEFNEFAKSKISRNKLNPKYNEARRQELSDELNSLPKDAEARRKEIIDVLNSDDFRVWDRIPSGFFFAKTLETASTYGDTIVPVFLNIRKPKIKDVEGRTWKWVDAYSDSWNVTTSDYVNDVIQAGKKDGVIFTNILDVGGKLTLPHNKLDTVYVALDSNQIKSATNNNGEFSRNSNDVRFSITTGGTDIQNNIESLFVNFNDAKGKSKQEIFSTYDNTHKVIAKLPDSMALPKELNVENKSVMIAEAYFLDHAHNHKHEKEYTIEDYKRGFSLINPSNEMRIVKEKRGNFSLAFIKQNPIDGWDCVVVAPKRGEFFIYKTMFGQKKKPYQNNKLIRHTASVRQGNAADVLIRGGLMSIHDVPETVGIKPNFGTDVNTPRYSITTADDATYMAAVQAYDMATAQKMVDEAARLAGYTIKAYHGTKAKFNVFKKGSKTGWLGKGIYFAENKKHAREYGKRVMHVYLGMKKPFISKKADWSGLLSEVQDLFPEVNLDNIADVLGSHGYDGIILNHWDKGNIISIFDNVDVKSADPVTYDDAGNVIPLSQRFNADNPDIRYSLKSKSASYGVSYLGSKNTDRFLTSPANKKQKRKVARFEADASADLEQFSMSQNRRATAFNIINKHRGVASNVDSDLQLTPGEIADAVEKIATLDASKEQEASIHWFVKGTIRVPEDFYKVQEALGYAERGKQKAKGKTDFKLYDSPMAMIEALHEFKPKEKPIDPDTVPEFTNKVEHDYGIVVYDVEDTRAGQLAVRKIINTHWGEDANPWCLACGDGHGNLSDGNNGEHNAWYYWNHYNAIPKKIAFKDGKLYKFHANDDVDEIWWDRNDKSSGFVHIINKPVPNDPFGRWADYGILLESNQPVLSEYVRTDKNGEELFAWSDDGALLTETIELPDGNIEKNRYNFDGDIFNKKIKTKDGRLIKEIYYHEGTGRIRSISEYDPTSELGRAPILTKKYYSNGVQALEITSNEKKEWYETGELKSKVIKDEDGTTTKEAWYPNGQKARYAKFSSVGLNMSDEIWWYEDGQLERVMPFNDKGERHGLCIENYNDGTPYFRGEYENNKKVGTHTYWYSNGQINEITNYVNGELHGVSIRYADDGSVRTTENYKDGKRHGVDKYYLEDYIEVVQFDEGKVISKERVPYNFEGNNEIAKFSISDSAWDNAIADYNANKEKYSRYSQWVEELLNDRNEQIMTSVYEREVIKKKYLASRKRELTKTKNKFWYDPDIIRVEQEYFDQWANVVDFLQQHFGQYLAEQILAPKPNDFVKKIRRNGWVSYDTFMAIFDVVNEDPERAAIMKDIRAYCENTFMPIFGIASLTGSADGQYVHTEKILIGKRPIEQASKDRIAHIMLHECIHSLSFHILDIDEWHNKFLQYSGYRNRMQPYDSRIYLSQKQAELKDEIKELFDIAKKAGIRDSENSNAFTDEAEFICEILSSKYFREQCKNINTSKGNLYNRALGAFTEMINNFVPADLRIKRRATANWFRHPKYMEPVETTQAHGKIGDVEFSVREPRFTGLITPTDTTASDSMVEYLGGIRNEYEDDDGNTVVNEDLFSLRCVMDGIGLLSIARIVSDEDSLTYENLPTFFLDGVELNHNTKLTPEDLKKVDSFFTRLVKLGISQGRFTTEQADYFYGLWTEIANKILSLIDVNQYDAQQGKWILDAMFRWSGSAFFRAIKTNQDSQYNISDDLLTICKKTEQLIDVVSKAMVRLGRGLTAPEILRAFEETGKAGFQTPCPICFVFSRWLRTGVLLNGFKEAQNYYVANGMYRSYDEIPAEEREAYAQMWLAEYQQVSAMIKANNKAFDKARNVIDECYDQIDQLVVKRQTTDNADEKLAIDEAIASVQNVLKKAYAVQQLKHRTKFIKENIISVSGDGAEAKVSIPSSSIYRIDEYGLYPDSKVVDIESIFNLQESGRVGEQYPLMMKYRNSTGSGGGKAVETLADNRMGEVLADLTQSETFRDKGSIVDLPFEAQVNALNKAIDARNKQLLRGGDRFQSWSDTRTDLLPDLLSNIIQHQLAGGGGQAYSKQTEGIELFARAAIYVNASLIAEGRGYEYDENGVPYLTFSKVQGIDPDASFALSQLYDKAGNILVGMSDEHIRIALSDPRIFFVIPYHASGLNKKFLHFMFSALGVTQQQLDDGSVVDYEPVQSEHVTQKTVASKIKSFWLDNHLDKADDSVFNQKIRKADNDFEKIHEAQLEYRYIREKLLSGQKLTDDELSYIASDRFLSQVKSQMEKYQVKGFGKADLSKIYPYEYWDETSTYDTADVNGKLYLEYCFRMGMIPKFCGITISGKRTSYGNLSEFKGYWKTLIDRRMYRRDGSYQPLCRIHVEPHPDNNMTGITFANLDPDQIKERHVISKPANNRASDRIVDALVQRINTTYGVDDIGEGDINMPLDVRITEYTDALKDARSRGIALASKPSKPKKKKSTKYSIRGAKDDEVAELLLTAATARFGKSIDPTDRSKLALAPEQTKQLLSMFTDLALSPEELTQLASMNVQDIIGASTDASGINDNDVAQLLNSVRERKLANGIRKTAKAGVRLGAGIENAANRAAERYTKNAIRNAKGKTNNDLVSDLGDISTTIYQAMQESVSDDVKVVEPLDEEQVLVDIGEQADKYQELIELRKATLAEKESEAQMGIGAGGDEPIATDDDEHKADESNAFKPQNLAGIPLELFKQAGIDLTSGADVAGFIREWIRSLLRDEMNIPADEDVFAKPRLQEEYRKSVVNILHDMARNLMSPSSGAKHKVDRMIASMHSGMTHTQVYNRSAQIAQVILNNLAGQVQMPSGKIKLETSQEIVDRLRRELKEMALARETDLPLMDDLRRKVTAKMVKRIQAIRHALKLSAEQVDFEIAELVEQLQEGGILTGNLQRTGVELLAEHYDMMVKLQALNEFGGLKYKLPAEVLAKREAILEQVSEARMDIEKRMAQREFFVRSMTQALIDAVNMSKHKYTPQRSRISNIVDNATATLRERLEYIISGADGKVFKEAQKAVDQLCLMISHANEMLVTTKLDYQDEYNAILDKLVGSGKAPAYEEHLADFIPEGQNAVLSKQGKRMTYGQVLHLWGYLKQADHYGDNIALHDRLGQLDYIESVVLDGTDIAFGTALMNLYDTRREQLSQVMEEYTGLPVNSPSANYMPVRMKRPAREGLDTKVLSFTAFAKSLTPRVKNELDVDEEADIISMYRDRSDDSARAISYGMTGILLTCIVGSSEFKDAVTQKYGATVCDHIVEQVTDAATDGKNDGSTKDFEELRLLSKLQTAASISALSWNLSPALKQLVSIPNWIMAADSRAGGLPVWKAITMFDLDSMYELSESQGFRARYGASTLRQSFKALWSEVTRLDNLGNVNRDYKDARANWKQQISKLGQALHNIAVAGFAPMQLADMIPSMLGGVGMYKHLKAKYYENNKADGMDDEAAMSKAMADASTVVIDMIEDAQQSSRMDKQTRWYRHGGAWGKAFVMFASAANLQMSHEISAARNLANRLDPEGKLLDAPMKRLLLNNPMALLIRSRGNNKPEVVEARRKLRNAVLVNHVYTPIAMGLVAELWHLLLAGWLDDDDEKLQDFGWSMLASLFTGPYSSWWLVGSSLHYLTERLLGVQSYSGGILDSSALQLAEKVVDGVGDVAQELKEMNWAEALDEAVDTTMSLTAPTRNIAEIMRNVDNYNKEQEREAQAMAKARAKQKKANERKKKQDDVIYRSY